MKYKNDYFIEIKILEEMGFYNYSIFLIHFKFLDKLIFSNMFKEFLRCDKCNDKDDESTKLPCGSTVCNYCIENLVDAERQDNSLKCTMCLRVHKYEEVFRRDLVEEFKENLNKIDMKKAKLEGILLNGADTERSARAI